MLTWRKLNVFFNFIFLDFPLNLYPQTPQNGQINSHNLFAIADILFVCV